MPAREGHVHVGSSDRRDSGARLAAGLEVRHTLGARARQVSNGNLKATYRSGYNTNPIAQAYGLAPVPYAHGVIERVDKNREVWQCGHNHESPEKAIECARREIRRRPRRWIWATLYGLVALLFAAGANYDVTTGYIASAWFWIVLSGFFGFAGLYQVWGTFGRPTIQNPLVGCVFAFALVVAVSFVVVSAAMTNSPTTFAVVAVAALGAAPYGALAVKIVVSPPRRRLVRVPVAAGSYRAPSPSATGQAPRPAPAALAPARPSTVSLAPPPTLPANLQPRPDALPSGTLTFLMTDVEGSSELFERQRAAMEQAMSRHDRLLARLVESNGGAVVTQQGEGDSMLAVFTTSRAALSAALDCQRAFREPDWPVPMKVRMGVLTGDARVVNGNYRGPAINRCGRIRSAAPAGQVFVAQSTATIPDNLPDGATFVKLGELNLKGVERPELVYQLVHPDLDDQSPPEV